MNDLRNYLKTSFNKSVLFDTGLIVDFLVGDPKTRLFFEDFVFSGHLTPVISAQTVCELFAAARNTKEESHLNYWLTNVFDVVEITYEIGKRAGLMKRNSGIYLGDAIIASTSILLGIPLVTTRPELYRKTDIRIFRPYS